MNTTSSGRVTRRSTCGADCCPSSESGTNTTSESICCNISESGEVTLTTPDTSVLNEQLEPVSSTLSETTIIVMGDQETNKLKRKLKSITADIVDHFDENAVDDSMSVDDVEKQITKIQNLRTMYREVYQELTEIISTDETDNVLEEYEQQYDKTMKNIKDYIATGNIHCKAIRSEESRLRSEATYEKDRVKDQVIAKKTMTTNFLVKEITRLVTELNNEYSKPTDDVPDEELFRRNKEMSENAGKMESLSKKHQQFLETIPETYPNRRNLIQTTNGSYDEVVAKKEIYETFVKYQVAQRELLKQAAFKTSNLNIPLSKFSGYQSELDVFTFRSEFEKLYAKETPSNRLADMLKNKHLLNPALALVKRMDDIQEIWARLIKAYGDPRIMLQNKLAEVKNIGTLSKIRDPIKLREALTAIVNAMHELLTLSTQFDIVLSLYHHPAFDMIQGMMGEPQKCSSLNK